MLGQRSEKAVGVYAGNLLSNDEKGFPCLGLIFSIAQLCRVFSRL